MYESYSIPLSAPEHPRAARIVLGKKAGRFRCRICSGGLTLLSRVCCNVYYSNDSYR